MKVEFSKNVSIIIPNKNDDTYLKKLLNMLSYLNAEVIVETEGTRAENLNNGATKATKEFLWFLHADSNITPENIKQLELSIQEHPNALHYFDLKFDGDKKMSINAWGANLRSRIFGTPFGDQGFCISKKMFEQAGKYPTNVPYGEDLIFVWHARQRGIKLNRVPSALLTSSRKYKQRGWLKLTLLYQWIWIKMSIPEAIKLLLG